MPSLTVTKEGLKEIEERQVGKKLATNYILRVFTNDKTPNVNDTIESYKEVKDDESYTTKIMQGSLWKSEIDEITATAKITYPRQVFSFSKSHTLYGIFITTDDDLLIASARFEAAPYNIPATGGVVNVDTGFSELNA